MLLQALLMILCHVSTGATLEEEYAALGGEVHEAFRLKRVNAELFAAAEACDEKRVQEMLVRGAVPSFSTGRGIYAAEAAASCEDPGTLHLLLAHGAAVDSPAYRESLLRRALGADRDRTVELLISMRTDPTEGLAASLDDGDAPLAGYFLRNGANVHAAEKRVALVKTALAKGMRALVPVLLSAGADPNNGEPLADTIRAEPPDHDLTRLLLYAGADANAETIDFLTRADEDDSSFMPFRSKFAGLRNFSMLQMAAQRCLDIDVAELLAHGARRGEGDETAGELARRAAARSLDEACLRTRSLLQ